MLYQDNVMGLLIFHGHRVPLSSSLAKKIKQIWRHDLMFDLETPVNYY